MKNFVNQDFSQTLPLSFSIYNKIRDVTDEIKVCKENKQQLFHPKIITYEKK